MNIAFHCVSSLLSHRSGEIQGLRVWISLRDRQEETFRLIYKQVKRKVKGARWQDKMWQRRKVVEKANGTLKKVIYSKWLFEFYTFWRKFVRVFWVVGSLFFIDSNQKCPTHKHGLCLPFIVMQVYEIFIPCLSK